MTFTRKAFLLPICLLFERLVEHHEKRHCCESVDDCHLLPMLFRLNPRMQYVFIHRHSDPAMTPLTHRLVRYGCNRIQIVILLLREYFISANGIQEENGSSFACLPYQLSE